MWPPLSQGRHNILGQFLHLEVISSLPRILNPRPVILFADIIRSLPRQPTDAPTQIASKNLPFSARNFIVDI